MLATGLLLVHNASGCGQDDVTELTGREKLDNPLLKLVETDVVAGGDDTALVEAAVELDNDLAGAVVIDLLELADAKKKCWSANCCEELKALHHWWNSENV